MILSKISNSIASDSTCIHIALKNGNTRIKLMKPQNVVQSRILAETQKNTGSVQKAVSTTECEKKVKRWPST